MKSSIAFIFVAFANLLLLATVFDQVPQASAFSMGQTS